MAMVLAVMYKHGEMTSREISNATGIEKEYVDDLLDRLRKDAHSIVKKFKTRKFAQVQRYSLKANCREWIRKGNLKSWGERYG